MSDLVQLLIDGSHGIYVPHAFVEKYEYQAWGISEDDARILRIGPDHLLYWDAWDDVLSEAYYVDSDGLWRLHQSNGDLFAYLGNMSDEEFTEYFGDL